MIDTHAEHMDVIDTTVHFVMTYDWMTTTDLQWNASLYIKM